MRETRQEGASTLASAHGVQGGVLLLALLATSTVAAFPYFSLPAWAETVPLRVGINVASDVGAALLGALAFAAVRRLLGRSRWLASSLGILAATSVCVGLPGSPGLVARLLGCGVLVGGIAFPRLAARVPTGAVAGLAVAGLVSALAFAPPVRPDLVLVTIDTLRADRVNSPEFARITPNIRKFAEGAVVFRRAWSTAPWTIPGMSSIFTGVHPSSHGAKLCSALGEAAQVSLAGLLRTDPGTPFPLFSQMSPELETLPMALSRAGYISAGFSSWFLVGRETGFAHGFDRFHMASLNDVIVVRLARDWLRTERTHSVRPAFLFVHLFAPHQPYAPPGLAIPFETWVETWNGVPVSQRVMRNRESLPPELDARIREAYDGEVRYADRSFGKILDALDELPQGRETLIALTADHGDFLGEKSLLDHAQFLFDEATHVPLIARFPASWSIGPGVSYDAVSNHDVYATFLSAAGVTARHALSSRDLREHVESAPRPARLVRIENEPNATLTSLFGDRFAHRFEAVTDGRWKLILTDGGGGELYDLESDSAETRNLAASEPDRVREMTRELAASRQRDVRFRPAGRPSFDAEQLRKLRALGYLR